LTDIREKVTQQLVDRDKGVRLLPGADMTVIPFPGLVVVAKNALAIDNIRKPVLEQMTDAPNRPHETPDDDLDEAALQDAPLEQQQHG
jgi:hypothetical protein